MSNILNFVFFISLFIIFWAMIGYALSLKLFDKLLSPMENIKDFNNLRTVTIMVVAHNEEKVILQKLENLLKLDYPKNRLKILVASDNSTDQTDNITNNFILTHPDVDISLFTAKNRKGKTNAQNEAQKTVNTEILVMTDANSILKSDAIKEIVASFSSDDIVYVTGKLEYINENKSLTSASETSYWDIDLEMRDIESRLQTITAGNGALYAVLNDEYIDFNPLYSHDSAMPTFYALQGKRAIFNKKAIAFEKAGETKADEFGRKVRMNRIILKFTLPSFKILNFFKYKWYTYFYLGHRTARYLLWISHIMIFITSLIQLIISGQWYNQIAFYGQLVFYSLAIFQYFFNSKNKLLMMINYYGMTILAQVVGVYRVVTKKAKPFWEKAETTR